MFKDFFKKEFSAKFKEDLVPIFQVVFYIIVGLTTVYNSYITVKHEKLIFKPVIGVSNVKAEMIIKDENSKSFNDVLYTKIIFEVKNTGSLPAKNVRIVTHGKIGNTTMSFTKSENISKGIIMVQNVTYTSIVTIGKEALIRLHKGEKLIYNVEISYTDFEEYEKYEYPQFFEVQIIQDSPVNIKVFPISEVENF